MASVHLNNKFLQHDWRDRRRGKFQGPRKKRQDGADIWAVQTEDRQEKEEQLRRMLAKIMWPEGPQWR